MSSKLWSWDKLAHCWYGYVFLSNHHDTCLQYLTFYLSIISQKSWKKPHTTKRTKLLIYITSLNPKTNMLDKKHQTQKSTYCMNLLTQNSRTHKFIYRDNKTDQWLPSSGSRRRDVLQGSLRIFWGDGNYCGFIGV